MVVAVEVSERATVKVSVPPFSLITTGFGEIEYDMQGPHLNYY